MGPHCWPTEALKFVGPQRSTLPPPWLLRHWFCQRPSPKNRSTSVDCAWANHQQMLNGNKINVVAVYSVRWSDLMKISQLIRVQLCTCIRSFQITTVFFSKKRVFQKPNRTKVRTNENFDEIVRKIMFKKENIYKYFFEFEFRYREYDFFPSTNMLQRQYSLCKGKIKVTST